MNKRSFTRSKSLKLFVHMLIVIFGLAYLYFDQSIPAATVIQRDVSYVAIVIDDFGNKGEGTEAILNVGVPITAAVMPFLPYSRHDADLAKNAGAEVILHLSMEPEHGKASWLGPKAITSKLSAEEVQIIVKEALDEVRWAIGINNHTGSKTTQDKRLMQAILQIAKDRNLCFIDSKTTGKSIVKSTADELNVVSLSRDIFLDNLKTQADIEKQMDKLANVALKNGFAIAIGHVGPEGGSVTARAIKAKYKGMESRGIRFVTISELVRILKDEKRGCRTN